MCMPHDEASCCTQFPSDLYDSCDPKGFIQLRGLLLARAVLHSQGHPVDAWYEWKHIARTTVRPVIEKYRGRHADLPLCVCSATLFSATFVLNASGYSVPMWGNIDFLFELMNHGRCEASVLAAGLGTPAEFSTTTGYWTSLHASASAVWPLGWLARDVPACQENRWPCTEMKALLAGKSFFDVWVEGVSQGLWQSVWRKAALRRGNIRSALSILKRATPQRYARNTYWRNRCWMGNRTMGDCTAGVNTRFTSDSFLPRQPASDQGAIHRAMARNLPKNSQISRSESIGTTALCVYGASTRVKPFLLKSLEENVIWPTKADTFFVLGDSLQPRELQEHLATTLLNLIQQYIDIRFLKGILLRSDPSPLELLGALVSKNATVGPLLGCPLFGQPGANLYQALMQRSCLDIIGLEEAGRHQTYKWIISSRLDLHWLGPHFSPLKLRKVSGTGLDLFNVAVPWGQENGGVNDRHIVVSRRLAGCILDIWGSHLRNRNASSMRKHLNGEQKWALHLQSCGARIQKFKPMALVTCCDDYETCEHFRDTVIMEPGQSGQVAPGICSRYPSEWTEVTLGHHTERALIYERTQGATWFQLASGQIVYGCFDHRSRANTMDRPVFPC